MFTVKFKVPGVHKTAIEYAPEGEQYACDEATARQRFDMLVGLGRAGIQVYGHKVVLVRIEDLSIPAGDDWDQVRNVVLSQFVEDDYAVGPWAEKAMAA